MILIGFKRVGKSYYGKLLADLIQLPFIDTDHLLEQKMGLSCTEIYKKLGEDRFRALEYEVLSSLKKQMAIVAFGGGTALWQPEVVAQLDRVVYLKMAKESVKKRLLTPPLPAFLETEDPESAFEQHYSLRLPLYEAFSHTPLIMDNKSEEEILEELYRCLNG